MLKISVIVICIMLMLTGAAVNCYSQGTGTIQGNVTAMDWVGSVLTVDETVFFVASNVEVIKGSDNISFSDVDIGDSVVVTYSQERDGSLKAVRIVVVYSGDFPI